MKQLVSTLLLGVLLVAPLGAQTPQISTEDIAALATMRQEEKLAHDVYAALGQKWGDRPFLNIAGAESQHMEAVRGLLVRYGKPDPIASLKDGEFKDVEFTNLYRELVKKGNASRLDALKVGAKIEELDLSDLNKRLATTKANDIKRVFENLARGSRNHLRAFAGAIKRAGGTYKAEHLSQAEFDKIANSPMERGR
ncbi:MAG TPA: DUF2202 domain-containing protein [Fimbriimonadaceae bacterium]|nr:DUF2202 domain-containing protein [Fimbriimonadaceae bacterium]